MAINKTEFINRLAEKGGIQKVKASANVDLFLDTLIESLKEEGIVKLYGFGRFELKKAKERVGRNPKNGQEYIIPEHKKVKFYAGEALADKMEK